MQQLTDAGLEGQGTIVKFKDTAPHGLRAKAPDRPAFVLYYPQGRKIRGQVFYNEEAWRILSLKVPPLGTSSGPVPDIGSLCSIWKALLDEGGNGLNGSHKKEPRNPSLIDTIQSYRRQYTVKGIILSDGVSDTKRQERSYLFLLERLDPDSMHLSQTARQLNLNRREQEIIQLLMRGFGNKEIAYALGLSLNTIKGYMKLLMGRMGVRNRVGIISMLLMLNGDMTHPSHPLSQPAQTRSDPLRLP